MGHPLLNIAASFRPKAVLSGQELSRGLRLLTFEGAVSMGFSTITMGGLMAAFALELGANNLQIGVLAAVPFLLQTLQIPTILMVERLKARKVIAVSTWFVAQALWFPIALIPFFVKVPSSGAVSLLIGLMAVRSALGAITSCGWNSWVRDLVPENILGRFFARRLAVTTMVALVFGLTGALFIGFWHRFVAAPDEALGYTVIFLVGASILGMSSVLLMSLMPEPMMQSSAASRHSLPDLLNMAFRDGNFMRVAKFLFFWTVAANLAIPFFAVYMLQRLGMSLWQVMLLTALSQLFNILFLRVWGPLTDRFGNKGVLSLSASLYLLVMLGWMFTAMPERYFLTVPLLIVLHIFAGAATAGVSITIITMGMKFAPAARATSYLAVAALASNLGSGLGALFGGQLAHLFGDRVIKLDFTLGHAPQGLGVPTLQLTGLDIVFAVAFVLGLVALKTLTTLREEGAAARQAVLDEMLVQAGVRWRPVSSAPNLSVGPLPGSYAFRFPGLDVALGVTAYQIAWLLRLRRQAVQQGCGAALALGRRSGRIAGGAALTLVTVKPGDVAVYRWLFGTVSAVASWVAAGSRRRLGYGLPVALAIIPVALLLTLTAPPSGESDGIPSSGPSQARQATVPAVGRLVGHVVQPGETLTGIAESYNSTVEELLVLNPQIRDPDLIRVGELLHLSNAGWSRQPWG